MILQSKRTRSITSAAPTHTVSKRRKTIEKVQQRDKEDTLPTVQSALKLHEICQPYEISTIHPLPEIQHDSELLVRVQAIGLNPIDWKAPDFNFGIPTLPYIAGREFAGTVVRAPTTPSTRIRKGDSVLVPSTDYRDLRKAAYQEYSVASSYNSIRLPPSTSLNSGSILGVAFVSAALTLGICMGLSFSGIENGPDILSLVRGLEQDSIPADIRQECLHGIAETERGKKGDTLVIWGAGSVCANVTIQIARLAGVKIVAVVDMVKHGSRLSSSTPGIRPDLLVDAHDPVRAVEVVKAYTASRGARFGFDTQGKETAGHLMGALGLASSSSSSLLPPSSSSSSTPPTAPPHPKLPTPPSTPSSSSPSQKAHLVGLTGLPKDNVPKHVALHSVPIKLYHEVPAVGEALSAWCERLLTKGLLVPPDVVGVVDGLGGVNAGLDRMRRREVSGGRLVAVLE